MNATILRAVGLTAVLLLTSGRSVWAAEKPPTADRIDFQVDVLAEDPFSSLNQVGNDKKAFRRGEVVRLVIAGYPRPGYHTYPMTQRALTQPEDMLTRFIDFKEPTGVKRLYPIHESEPEFKKEVGFGAILEYEKPFYWTQDLLIKADATPGAHPVRFVIKIQVCNKNSCVWGQHPFEVTIPVSDAPALTLTPELEKRLAEKPTITVLPVPPGMAEPEEAATLPSASTAIPIDDKPGQHRADLEALAAQFSSMDGASGGFFGFILAGIFWGGVSLITPCVFPMIPITVSFFLKQSEKQHHRPVTMALVYCGTIIVVLTIAAVALLSFFRELSTSPVMNYFLGALFIFFALSLFGMYEIELPSSLASFTSSREGKGGLLGTMFMALTFTIISFACVAPFLGGFGGTAAASKPSFLQTLFGGFAFATTFASPFFVLALFPTLLKQMPKSGNWLNNVKVVMGFLELAAALKFFRAGELVQASTPTFFTYDFVLGLYVALALLCGLYLLNVYRLPHDTPVESLSVPRLLFSLLFLGLAFYLAPALFKINAEGDPQRPRGSVYAWVDSFLLPEPSEGKGELRWSGNLKQALDTARAETQKTGKQRLVFVDFTGETCTNCKINEHTVFTKSDIRKELQRYQLVQLYTDKVPDKFYSSESRSRFGGDTKRQREDAEANLSFQRRAFGTEQLPLYVILRPEPDGKITVVNRYDEGKINNDAAFAEFLKKPLQESGVTTAQLGR